MLFKFLVFNAADIKDLDLDPELGILDEEAEAWVGTVDKKVSKKLKEKEIKRQEHIYEFIITEKHHCLTLKVMQKVRTNHSQLPMNTLMMASIHSFYSLVSMVLTIWNLDFRRRDAT